MSIMIPHLRKTVPLRDGVPSRILMCSKARLISIGIPLDKFYLHVILGIMADYCVAGLADSSTLV